MKQKTTTNQKNQIADFIILQMKNQKKSRYRLQLDHGINLTAIRSVLTSKKYTIDSLLLIMEALGFDLEVYENGIKLWRQKK